jgi:hypothetical protein
MQRMQRMKKELMRTREKFMISVVSFDERSRVLMPNNKNKKKERTDGSMRIFPVLAGQKLMTSLCNEDTHIKRL